MPRGDRTGPLGEGPMTGRQLGYGAGYDTPGYTKGGGMGAGRGFFGRGRGFSSRGRGYRYFWRGMPDNADIRQAPAAEDEVGSLRAAVQDLKSGMSAILERLNRLDKGKKEE